MKKILIVLLALGSLSSFAKENLVVTKAITVKKSESVSLFEAIKITVNLATDDRGIAKILGDDFNSSNIYSFKSESCVESFIVDSAAPTDKGAFIDSYVCNVSFDVIKP